MRLLKIFLLLTLAGLLCSARSQPGFGVYPHPTTAAGSSFPSSGLVSYWKLDESSGNAADQLGGNTLVNNNSVTYGSAKINNGATFVTASSKFLRVSNPVNLHLNAITVTCWINLTTLPTSSGARFGIVSKFSAGTPGWEIDIDTAANKMRSLVSLAGTGTTIMEGTVGTLSTGTWYFVCLTWDGSTLTASVNANTRSTVACSGTLSAESNDCCVGARGDTLIPANCQIDEVAVWNRAITTTEESTVYNTGAGRTYP